MVRTPPVLTSRDAYLRFICDRAIDERDFGKILKDRSSEIDGWSRKLSELQGDLDHAFFGANDHFQGFAPGTVNRFRNSLGLTSVEWQDTMRKPALSNQNTLM